LHGLRLISIADLIRYRLDTERFVRRQAEAAMPSAFGNFRAIGYRNELDGSEHVAIVKGDPERAEGPVLVDCLTLWLSNLLGAGRDIAAETATLCATLKRAKGPVVLVSNEVGLGIVPDNAMAREFRDHAGRLHQAVGAVASHVVFVAAGLPLFLKGPKK
jgi:adenosyl cobinamide kinase/adenosyl cobinamide phosphate guanylyltransferase